MREAKLEKFRKAITELALRGFTAFITAVLCICVVKFEPMFQEIGTGLLEMTPREWAAAIGAKGAFVILYALAVLAFLRYAKRTVQEQLNDLKRVKKRVPLDLVSTRRLTRAQTAN